MPRYVYAGPGPVDDGEGGIVRPGDIRGTEPDWGPWDELPDDDEDGAEEPAEAPAVPAPATERARPATASTAPPATVPARTDPES
jgi:hypothetical protein